MAFYAIFALYGDINKIYSYFLKIKIEFIVLILVVQVISLIIRGLRQQKLIQEIGLQIPFLENLKIYFAGLSMIVTPGGAGEVIKSHFFKNNYGKSISETIPIVFVERYHELLAVTTIILFSLFFYFLLASAIIVIISTAILIAMYIIATRKNLLLKCQQKLMKVKFLSRFVPGTEFNETIHKLSRPKIMITSWGISLASWLIEVLAVYIAFLAFEQDFALIQVSQFYFTSLAYGAISFIPGGVGITEGSFVGLLMTYGLDISIASALVLFVRINTIWFATILGLISSRFVLKLK